MFFKNWRDVARDGDYAAFGIDQLKAFMCKCIQKMDPNQPDEIADVRAVLSHLEWRYNTRKPKQGGHQGGGDNRRDDRPHQHQQNNNRPK